MTRRHALPLVLAGAGFALMALGTLEAYLTTVGGPYMFAGMGSGSLAAAVLPVLSPKSALFRHWRTLLAILMAIEIGAAVASFFVAGPWRLPAQWLTSFPMFLILGMLVRMHEDPRWKAAFDEAKVRAKPAKRHPESTVVQVKSVTEAQP